MRTLNLFIVFAVLAGRSTAVPSAPPAELLAQAIDSFQTGEGRWAYVKTTEEFSRKGKLKSIEVVRHDPSQPWDEREILVARDGELATDRQQKSFQRDREKNRLKRERRMGKNERLRDRLDLSSAELIESSESELRYHVSLIARPDDDFPADKLESIITLHPGSEELKRVDLRLRESFRKAGIVKLKTFEMTVKFQPDMTKEHPATMNYLEASAVASVLLFPVGGSAQLTFDAHRWVKPYDERFEVQMGESTVIGF